MPAVENAVFAFSNGTFYIGITSNLVEQIDAHQQKYVDGFIQKYAVDKVVYYEIHI